MKTEPMRKAQISYAVPSCPETPTGGGSSTKKESVDKNIDNSIDKIYAEPSYISGKKSYFMPELPFTIPVIMRGKYHWWIEYYFQNPYRKDKWDRFRLYGKINNKKYAALKEFNAERLRQDIEIQLRQGKVPSKYRTEPPIVVKEPRLSVVRSPELVTSVGQSPAQPLPEKPAPTWDGVRMALFPTVEKLAVEQSLGKNPETLNALRLYNGRLKKFFIAVMRDKAIAEGKYFTDEEVESVMVMELTAARAQEFRSYMIEEMELSNASVNSTLGAIRGHMKVCVQMKQIPDNPFEFVKLLPKKRGTTFTPFTTEEQELISGHLKANNPDLYLFSCLIYYCFIRPKELCALVPSDIDLNAGLIQVRGDTSKNKHSSYRQIPAKLKKILLERKVLSLPATLPIFVAICGNEKSLRVRRRKVTELWRQAVKETLGIDKEMYGMKHTGNIDYLKSLPNIGQANLQWLKQQNDHLDLAVTQNYIAQLGIVKMKDEDFTHGTF